MTAAVSDYRTIPLTLTLTLTITDLRAHEARMGVARRSMRTANRNPDPDLGPDPRCGPGPDPK